MDIPVVASGIAVGAGFGFALQRGRFCLNTAFRNAFYIKDFTLLRSYLLALVIAVLCANLLNLAGILHLDSARQQFSWLASAVGGSCFGIGMVLAGGDAAASWYRAGEGLVGSWVAQLGFMIGAAAASHGALARLSLKLNSAVLSTGPALAPHGLRGWVFIGLLSIVALVFVLSGRSSSLSAQAGYSWRTSGILVGVLVVIGLLVSELMTGAASGITFPAATAGLLDLVVNNGKWDWGVAMAAGVPLGSLISAAALREFAWRAPHADVLIQQFAGGLIMGAGGMIAGGCSIGHGLSGIALLSPASAVSMAFIILGSAFMVYLLFMRGSRTK